MTIAAVVSDMLVHLATTMIIVVAVSGQAQTGRGSTEFTGCYTVVQPRDSMLVGVAEARSGAIFGPGPPSWPRAPVTLRRNTCNSSDSSSQQRINVF